MKRKTVVAGLFYPKTKEELEKQISGFLSEIRIKKRYRIIISPHAGYIYSGKTQAYAISSLQKTNRIIILGPDHNSFGSGFSVCESDEWIIPNGTCVVDRELRNKILESGLVNLDENAHKHEHSIEVQLPFIKYIFKKFTFLPISISSYGYDDYLINKCRRIGEVIANIMNEEEICMIISSDFTHYMPLDIARKMDKKALDKIKCLDMKGFFKVLEDMNASICGYVGIAVAITTAKKLNLNSVDVIHSSSSGDLNKDYSSVVTYYAVGFR